MHIVFSKCCNFVRNLFFSFM